MDCVLKMCNCLRMILCCFLMTLITTPSVYGQYGGAMYSRLNPITYYGFTQPYLSGFYGGIGGMPYMSSWQASMYQGNNQNNPMALMGLGMMGGLQGLSNGGLGGMGYGSWNAAPASKQASFYVILLPLLSLLLYKLR